MLVLFRFFIFTTACVFYFNEAPSFRFIARRREQLAHDGTPSSPQGRFYCAERAGKLSTLSRAIFLSRRVANSPRRVESLQGFFFGSI